ncbi:MAG: methyltransferase domain-containing protein [Blastocatellales bacterium]|nr:methyltransferase domain-containing protein [Blastocatellales bacterium]
MMKRWDAGAYDQKHSFVFQYGEGVFALLAPKAGERILDVGCGTGHLTKQIADAGASVVGLDASADMIERARASYPGIEFILGDAADFEFDEPFDAVFSNAALHWVERAEDAVICMSRALRQGGRFVIEMGGKGNIERIAVALDSAIEDLLGRRVSARNYFPGISEYSTLLERHGLEVRAAHLFDRLTELEEGEAGLRRWIEMFRGHLFDGVDPDNKEAVLERVERELRESLFLDGNWYADYRRLRINAIKIAD